MYKLSEFSTPKETFVTQKLKFIDLLTQLWCDIHNQNEVFRYKVDKIQEKVIQGNYLLQLNPDRSSKRRIPEQIENIAQPFDGNKFNFTKASTKEVIFKLHDEVDETHTIFVNVSPISQYHSLLCPSMEKCLPQVITEDSLLLILKIYFLAGDRDLRIGFNSLCAMASVNHLHYHLFLEKHDLPIETAICTHLHKEVHCFTDYPIPGFCFEVSENNIVTITEESYKLIAYLLKNSLAHNIFLTRGSSLTGCQKEVVRLIIWPRKSSAGAKQLASFNVAICEMSGWFPVYNTKDYETLNKENLEAELRRWKIDDFHKLCDHIKKNI
ncbi:GDP-D-glucose phosphorylase 1 [Amyelois transitella]|uniref:GDP-D-glucose phosphorylase 1 n=1 Tax=Amyelois transitella TaxID=680683 RepID=UPI00067D6C57|nr:GDP-D-glucose phosphorylase 1 [Amyelois transitella]